MNDQQAQQMIEQTRQLMDTMGELTEQSRTFAERFVQMGEEVREMRSVMRELTNAANALIDELASGSGGDV